MRRQSLNILLNYIIISQGYINNPPFIKKPLITKSASMNKIITYTTNNENIVTNSSLQINQSKNNHVPAYDLDHRYTFFDCFIALVFGGQWSAAFFWKEVEKKATRDLLTLGIGSSIIYVLFNSIQHHFGKGV